jgi:hypothetical protein
MTWILTLLVILIGVRTEVSKGKWERISCFTECDCGRKFAYSTFVKTHHDMDTFADGMCLERREEDER